jgi:hypothetical protein
LGDSESRYSTAFRLRVRRAVYDFMVDEQAAAAHKRVETDNDFILSAPEDPLPVIRPTSATDAGAVSRFWSAEMDDNDWARRDQIFAQYGASVRSRLQQCDPSLAAAAPASSSSSSSSAANPVKPVKASPPLIPLHSPFDDLDSLPPLTDARFTDPFEMPSAVVSSASSTYFSSSSLPPPPPLAVPGSFTSSSAAPPPPLAPPALAVMASTKLPPPPMQTVGFGVPPSVHAVVPMGSASFDGEELDAEAMLAGGAKGRRKWIKMERIPGQVDLYRAFEKALKELRDFKAHAAPFIQKVCWKKKKKRTNRNFVGF